MSRTYAILLRYSSHIGTEELAKIRARYPAINVFALKIDEPRAGVERIPVPPTPVNTDPEMYFSDLVHSFLAGRAFKKVLFWGCPEFAVTVLRVQLCHLDFGDVAFALCPPRVSPVREAQRFLFVEALSLCSSMKSTDEAGAFEFFSREAPMINADALFEPSKITVAIPTKDRWSLLKQTILSLEAQTFRDFDILIGDDGSIENGRIEFDAWLAKRRGLTVEIVRNPRSHGPGATRNALAKMAKTPYVAFFDDDNLANPRMLETWSKLTRLPCVDAFSCAYESFIDKETGGTERGSDSVFIGKVVGTSIGMNGFGDSASLFKRSSLLAAGGFNEDPGVLFEDFEFFLRMSMLGYELRTIPYRLFKYRRHAKQRSHTAAAQKGLETLAATSKKWNLKYETPKSKQPRLVDFALGWRSVDHLS